MDSTLVRIGVGFYVLLAGFALFLLWRNSAAPDGLKNIGILLASTLPVLIAVLPYLNPEKIEKKFTLVLFYDSKDKAVFEGDKLFNPYFSSYMPMFTNLSYVQDALGAQDCNELQGKKGLDIIEKGIVEALMLKFRAHWDIETSKFENPIGSSESGDFDPKIPIQVIKAEEIRNFFKDNSLIANPKVLGLPEMSLPPNTTIQVNSTDKSRTITFSNAEVNLKISIIPTMYTVAQQGVWGVFRADVNIRMGPYGNAIFNR